MRLEPIDLASAVAVGRGAARQEDVAIARDGTVWLSDDRSACARVRDDGSLERIGTAGGTPNGINFDRHGRIVIANFGGPTDGFGPLQRLDPWSGAVETLCGEIDGRRLFGANYPIVDSQDRIWCSHSTWGPFEAAFSGLNDGLIFRYDPDGSVHVLARDIAFANGIALDYDERHLYVCETTGCDVLRYPIAADGTLGTPQRYGPTLGLPPSGVEQLRSMTPEARGQLGMTDGCGFDQAGNLWVTVVMKNAIVAITPEGDVVTMLSDPEGRTMRHPTNVSWGGADLCDLTSAAS